MARALPVLTEHLLLPVGVFEQVNTKWNAPLGLPAGLKKGIVRITP